MTETEAYERVFGEEREKTAAADEDAAEPTMERPWRRQLYPYSIPQQWRVVIIADPEVDRLVAQPIAHGERRPMPQLPAAHGGSSATGERRGRFGCVARRRDPGGVLAKTKSVGWRWAAP